MRSPFVYCPLSCSQTIRLLVLRPSFSPNGPIDCQLKLAKLSDSPRYETLSYTWDNQAPSTPIRCNGAHLLVTSNVEAALRQLRSRVFKRYLWIDAICIDQGNVEERNAQVSMMGQIYSSAARVVVWLGVGDDNTARGIWALKWVFPLYKLALHVFFLRYVSQRIFRNSKASLQEALLHDDTPSRARNPLKRDPRFDHIRSLHRIIHHDWFRRIWTIQEISLAKKAVILCGSSRIGWESFSNALSFDRILSRPTIPFCLLVHGGYNPSTPVFRGVPFVSRMQQIHLFQTWMRRKRFNASWLGKHIPLHDRRHHSFTWSLLLIGLNLEYKATDPRDRVFGLLGLLRTFDAQVLPAADYEKNLSEIILSTITTIATKHGSLDFLLYVTGDRLDPILPSWVPNSSAVPWCPQEEDEEDVDRIARTAPHFYFKEALLTVRGAVVDEVTCLTETTHSEEDHGGRQSYAALALDSKSFATQIHLWIRFVRQHFQTSPGDNDAQLQVLFRLFLHPQVSRYYESTGLPIFDTAGYPRDPTVFYSDRLIEHFRVWLKCIEMQDDILFDVSDHVFDQVQHFISSERMNIDSITGDRQELTIGYQRALMVVQRWVREFTAHKRLFASTRGLVGIAWQGIRRGDLIVSVPGLASPLVLRSVDDGAYRVLGPCYIPAGLKASGVRPGHTQDFRLI